MVLVRTRGGSGYIVQVTPEGFTVTNLFKGLLETSDAKAGRAYTGKQLTLRVGEKMILTDGQVELLKTSAVDFIQV
jgi:hypothetical protein